MSQIQEALSRKDLDCTDTAAQVFAPPETVAQKRYENKHDKKHVRESDCLKLPRGSILLCDRYQSTCADRPKSERASQNKFATMTKAVAAGKSKRSESKSISVPHQHSRSAQTRQNENEPVSAQIRRFQERADLRECLLPGMLSGISPRACEGWQRKSLVRTSKAMAKIKLEPCKKCRFGCSLQ
jgi:hypothetical protein